jgi:hypothetical protein
MKKGITKVGMALVSAVLVALGFSSCNPFKKILPQPLEYGTPDVRYIEKIDSVGENMNVPEQNTDNGTENQR